jgi:hypothetical protein
MKKFLWSFAAVLAVISISFAAASCGGGSPGPRPTPVEGVSINDSGHANNTSIGLNQPFTMTAVLDPANATLASGAGAVTWTTSDSAKITVTKKTNPLEAEVKGIALADTWVKITVTVTGKDGSTASAERSYKVITPIAVTSVSLNAAEYKLTVNADGTNGSTRTVTATILPETATDKAVTWEIEDESVAVIQSNDGLSVVIKALKIGETTIRVTTHSEDEMAEADIIVEERPEGAIPPESIVFGSYDPIWIIAVNAELTGDDPALHKYMTLTATVEPDEAEQGITWKYESKNAAGNTATDVVSAEEQSDGSFKLRALNAGTVTVTATSSDLDTVFAEAVIQLRIPLKNIEVAPLVFDFGKTPDLTPSWARLPFTAYIGSITSWKWEIADTTVASIQGGDNIEEPKVKALKAGDTTYTLTIVMDGDTYTSEPAAIIVRPPLTALPGKFPIACADQAGIEVSPANVKQGVYTNDLALALGPAIVADYASDSAGIWRIEIDFDTPCTVLEFYKGVRVQWGFSCYPDGTKIDAMGMYTVRLKAATGMLILDLGAPGGWYAPSGGFLAGGWRDWDFVANDTGWADGSSYKTSVSGMLIEFKDQFQIHPNETNDIDDVDQKHPNDRFYVYAVEFYK